MKRSVLVNRRSRKFNRNDKSLFTRRDIYKMQEHSSLNCPEYRKCLEIESKKPDGGSIDCFDCERFNEDETMEFAKEISSDILNKDVSEHKVRIPNGRDRYV